MYLNLFIIRGFTAEAVTQKDVLRLLEVLLLSYPLPRRVLKEIQPELITFKDVIVYDSHLEFIVGLSRRYRFKRVTLICISVFVICIQTFISTVLFPAFLCHIRREKLLLLSGIAFSIAGVLLISRRTHRMESTSVTTTTPL